MMGVWIAVWPHASPAMCTHTAIQCLEHYKRLSRSKVASTHCGHRYHAHMTRHGHCFIVLHWFGNDRDFWIQVCGVKICAASAHTRPAAPQSNQEPAE